MARTEWPTTIGAKSRSMMACTEAGEPPSQYASPIPARPSSASSATRTTFFSFHFVRGFQGAFGIFRVTTCVRQEAMRNSWRWAPVTAIAGFRVAGGRIG